MAIFGNKTEEETQKTDTAKSAAAPVYFSDILVQPRVSEKASRLVKENKYVFKVKPEANKVEVRKAVEKQYNVKVLDVNIIKVKGKLRAFGRTSGKTSDFKKAVVTLKEGDRIEEAREAV